MVGAITPVVQPSRGSRLDCTAYRFTYVSGYSSPPSISVSVAGGVNSTYSVDYGCTYSLSPTSASYDTLADGGSFTVTSPGGCGLTATTGYSWIHPTGSGNGSGTVSYTVDANVSTNSRSGTIWVGGQAFVVNQLGVEEVIALGVAWHCTCHAD